MPKYRIKAGASLPYNDGTRAHVYTEGEEVTLPAHVATDVAVRWMLEPLDDDARYSLMPVDPQRSSTLALSGAAHERVQALGAELTRLDEQREAVQKRLDAAKAEQDQIVQKMAEGGNVTSKPGESINGVPVRVIDPGDGSTTAGVVHGEPTKLEPGTSGVVTPGSAPAQQPAATAAAPGTSNEAPAFRQDQSQTRQSAQPPQQGPPQR